MPDSTIRSDVRDFLAYLAGADYRPPAGDIDVRTVRASFDSSVPRTDLSVGELATIQDLTIPSPAGGIPARLFDPRLTRAAGPAVAWFHGGGFVTGGLDSYTSLAAQVSRELDLPVVLVDYRLAPESPFPAAHDDAETAARWLATGPPELGRAVDALVLAGDSAGGNLTIATTMALRDRPAAVPVLAQLAVCPSTDGTRTYPSEEEFADGYLLTRAGRRWYREQHRPVSNDVRMSPLLGEFTGLPPAVVLTAGLDPNRDEGRAYAAALVAAGVPTTYREATGNIHAFVLLRKVVPSAQGDITSALTALREALTTT
ncbi:MAG TPA: alpha/beta hydrolase [Pseudonocardiaceae bacterium]|jgi:acetyl esterase|nr:alpha/beta hydrolase [Pseudonocardiaceae bacterium]